MKKPYKHTELSDVLCSVPGCRNRIKKNVVARSPEGKPLICHECHLMKTRNMDPGAYKKYREGRARDNQNNKAVHVST